MEKNYLQIARQRRNREGSETDEAEADEDWTASEEESPERRMDAVKYFVSLFIITV